MDFTLHTKKKYVSFYRGERLVSFIVRTSSIRMGFMSDNQMPLLMVWREYYRRGQVEHASPLFSIWLPWRRPYPNVPVLDFQS